MYLRDLDARLCLMKVGPNSDNRQKNVRLAIYLEFTHNLS